MSKKHADKSEARKRLKKYSIQYIAQCLYASMVEGKDFEKQEGAFRSSDFAEDMYRIAEGAYNIRGSKLGKPTDDDRDYIQNRYKGGRYANEYNSYGKRIENTVSLNDILTILNQYPNGIPENMVAKVENGYIPMPFEEILWKWQNGESTTVEQQNPAATTPTELSADAMMKMLVPVVVLVLLFIFRKAIFRGIGTIFGYLLPIGLFAAVIYVIFGTLARKGQNKPQSSNIGDYIGFYIGAAGITAIFVVFKNFFLYEMSETWAPVLLLAGYASIIYAIILFIWRFVLHKGKVNDLIKKLNILYSGYVLGVVLLAVLAGVVDGAGAKIMLAAYAVAIGLIVIA